MKNILSPKKKISFTITISTRSKSLNKLSENTLVKTNLHGKKMIRFLGSRVFNSIVELNFYKKCNSKHYFKKKIKEYLIDDGNVSW